jgi:hypothetical protein
MNPLLSPFNATLPLLQSIKIFGAYSLDRVEGAVTAISIVSKSLDCYRARFYGCGATKFFALVPVQFSAIVVDADTMIFFKHLSIDTY